MDKNKAICYNDFLYDITKKISNDLSENLHEWIIKGLNLKGFYFNTKKESDLFVKDNCRIEDYTLTKERIYYVNNTPFFVHYYATEPLEIPKLINKFNKINVSFGTYKYL